MEFKQEAVQMASMPGMTLRQVAKDLGIGEGVLGRWERELKTYGKRIRRIDGMPQYRLHRQFRQRSRI